MPNATHSAYSFDECKKAAYLAGGCITSAFVNSATILTQLIVPPIIGNAIDHGGLSIAIGAATAITIASYSAYVIFQRSESDYIGGDESWDYHGKGTFSYRANGYLGDNPRYYPDRAVADMMWPVVDDDNIAHAFFYGARHACQTSVAAYAASRSFLFVNLLAKSVQHMVCK